jgi:excisionase family DNA binding protein
MPIRIDGDVYYTTREACREVAVSRATIFRWLRKGVLKQLWKDRRGWRLFTEDDLNILRAEAEKIEVEELG